MAPQSVPIQSHNDWPPESIAPKLEKPLKKIEKEHMKRQRIYILGGGEKEKKPHKKQEIRGTTQTISNHPQFHAMCSQKPALVLAPGLKRPAGFGRPARWTAA